MGRIALGLALLLLAGCTRDTPEAVLVNYAERVANLLEQPLPEAQPPPALPLPRRRERRLPVTELRAGLLESLDLAPCGLLPLIAERNSSLGKVKPPSLLLDYEFRFFDLLEQCQRRDRQQPLQDAEFSRFLNEIYRVKRANLYPVAWNAIFTSSELERNLSLAKTPLPLRGNPGYGDSLRALQTLLAYRDAAASAATGSTFTPPHEAALERHYFALYASEYGSQLFSSLRLLTGELNRVSLLLERAAGPRPLCLSGRPIPRARHLRNVLERFYGGELLPYMAQLQQQGQAWLELLERLAEAPAGQPASPLAAYRRAMLSTTSEQGLWQHYQRAIHRHTERWQVVLRQCGLMPGVEG